MGVSLGDHPGSVFAAINMGPFFELDRKWRIVYSLAGPMLKYVPELECHCYHNNLLKLQVVPSASRTFGVIGVH
jgi:hypothetical protein